MTHARCRGLQVYGRSWGACDLWSSRIVRKKLEGYFFWARGFFFFGEFWILSTLGTDLRRRKLQDFDDRRRLRKKKNNILMDNPPPPPHNKETPNVALRDSAAAVLQWSILTLGFNLLLTTGGVVCVKRTRKEERKAKRERKRGRRFRQPFLVGL